MSAEQRTAFKTRKTARTHNRRGAALRLAMLLALVAGLFGCASEEGEVCVDRGRERYTPEVLEGTLLWNEAGAEIRFACPGTVLVRFGPIPQKDGEPRTVGWTHVPSSGRITVVLDNTKEWSSESIRRIVAHEMGHVLGIAEHVDDPEAMMFHGPTVNELSAHDREALCSAIGGSACSDEPASAKSKG